MGVNFPTATQLTAQKDKKYSKARQYMRVQDQEVISPVSDPSSTAAGGAEARVG